MDFTGLTLEKLLKADLEALTQVISFNKMVGRPYHHLINAQEVLREVLSWNDLSTIKISE